MLFNKKYKQKTINKKFKKGKIKSSSKILICKTTTLIPTKHRKNINIAYEHFFTFNFETGFYFSFISVFFQTFWRYILGKPGVAFSTHNTQKNDQKTRIYIMSLKTPKQKDVFHLKVFFIHSFFTIKMPTKNRNFILPNFQKIKEQKRLFKN